MQEENEELKEKAPMKLIAKNNKYRSALEEIKEIISDEIDKTDADDELMQIYGTIYNRCNEVLNEQK